MSRALVVGGSLGGLTAALVLRDQGWDVDVLERRSEDRRGRFARAYAQETVQIPVPGKLSLSLPELLSAVDRVLRLAKKPHIHDVVPRALDELSA